MAIRNDVVIDWNQSPRIITVQAPSTAISMQDLIDTLRFKEASTEAMDNPPIVDASGKENLGGGTKVGLTIKLLNAKVAFEARFGPDWVLCSLDGGNLVAVDAVGADMDARHPTAFVTIDRTSSASATLQEQDALQYSSYQNRVWVDIGNGNDGTDFPFGTREHPVSNVQDAVSIALEKGFDTLAFLSDVVLGAGDNVSNMLLEGISQITNHLDMGFDASCFRTRFKHFTITGILDGESIVEDCIVDDIVYFSGHIMNSSLNNRVSTGGTGIAKFTGCAMNNFADAPPEIDCGAGGDVMFVEYTGHVFFTHLSDPNNRVGVGLSSGKVIVDSTCTDGYLGANGIGEFDISAGPTCTIHNNLLNKPEIAEAVMTYTRL